jgi:hypothetical protein
MSSELRTRLPQRPITMPSITKTSARKNLVAQGLVWRTAEIVFQGDIDGDNTVDYVRYYLSGSSHPTASTDLVEPSAG